MSSSTTGCLSWPQRSPPRTAPRGGFQGSSSTLASTPLWRIRLSPSKITHLGRIWHFGSGFCLMLTWFFLVYLFLHTLSTSLLLFVTYVLLYIHIFQSSCTCKPLFITSIFFHSSYLHLVSSLPQSGEATVLPRQSHSGCCHHHPPVQGLPGRARLLLCPGHVLGNPSAWWLLWRPLCWAFKSSKGGGADWCSY